MKKLTKKQGIIVLATIGVIIILSYISWSLWSWIALAGFILLALGWSLKK